MRPDIPFLTSLVAVPVARILGASTWVIAALPLALGLTCALITRPGARRLLVTPADAPTLPQMCLMVLFLVAQWLLPHSVVLNSAAVLAVVLIFLGYVVYQMVAYALTNKRISYWTRGWGNIDLDRTATPVRYWAFVVYGGLLSSVITAAGAYLIADHFQAP